MGKGYNYAEDQTVLHLDQPSRSYSKSPISTNQYIDLNKWGRSVYTTELLGLGTGLGQPIAN
jgi:hypothetical protein